MEEKKSFSDYLRLWFKWITDPLGVFFNKLGIKPNTMTILGVTGTALGAYMLARGNMLWGGLLILITVPFDALDGTMARLRGEANEWGAFVDSVADRYSELITYAGLLYYFLDQGNVLGSMLVFAAASGSVLVSYVKARAESVNLFVKGGILTRVERYIVLAPALVFNQPMVALWILAILTHITAFQRIYMVRKDAYRKHFINDGEKND
ncbi:CDP-alcohol phosphatidyltransferase family protein [Chloroflexota bacterium]